MTQYRHKFLTALAIEAQIILGFVALIALFTLTTAVHARQTETTANILLTEIFYDTPGTDADEEWVELANFGLEEVALSDYKLGDEEQTLGKEGMFRFPEGSVIAPGQIIVVAQNAQGFRALFGRNPDYEIAGSDPLVPDMRRYALWSVGEFQLGNEGDEVLLLDDKDRLVDGINYGDNTPFFDPAISRVYTGQSIARIPAACDSNSAADWQPARFPMPGELHLEGDCVIIETTRAADVDLIAIGQIQGTRDVSPYVNQWVDFRAVVTGMLEDRNAAGIIFYTLFVQDAPGQEDGDLDTSDGIAVFLGRQRPAYEIGDHLRVAGQVTEFFGLTEIDDNGLEISEAASDSPLPAAIAVDPPADSAARIKYFESREGMLVTIPNVARVVGPTHSGCGFAVIDNDSTAHILPRQSADDSADQAILVLHNSDVDCRELPDLKTDDTVTGLGGPLSFHFDKYKLVQQDSQALHVIPAPWLPLTPAPEPSAGQFSVASFNLENYFDGSKDMTNRAEPVLQDEALAIKQRKLANSLAITLGCPTLVGVQEVENEQLLQALVAQTAVQCGFKYQINHRDSVDSRGLDVALLSDPRRVQTNSVELRQTCSSLATEIEDQSIECPDQTSALFGRAPLQVDLLVDGSPYSLFVNHFKSKRGGAKATEERRVEQAQHLRDLVNQQSIANPDSGIIVLGDFNDYELSPTMTQMIEGANLYNTLERVPKEERYTYIFDGMPQLIDGILVSATVEPQIATVAILHVNADYPVALAGDASSRFVAYRTSDHDLPLLILNLPQGKLPATVVPGTEQEFDPAPNLEPTNSAEFKPTPTPTPTPTPMPTTTPNINVWGAACLMLIGLAALFLLYRARLK